MAKRTLITAPTSRALDVETFKTYARIDDTSEDVLIGNLLDSAEAEAENFTWRKFVTQTWDEYFDGFCDPLRLSFAPVSSITSISYVDENGTTKTLASSVYELGDDCGVPLVRRKYNQVWPTTRAHEDVVIVRYVVGYASSSVVPQRILHAIAARTAWQYRNREGMTEDAFGNMSRDETFYRLLRPFRLQRFQAIGAKT